MPKFVYVEYFLLLIPIIFLTILLYFKGGKKTKFGPYNDLKEIFKNNSFYYKIYNFFIVVIFFLFITIFAKPVEENTIQKINKDGIDIQIVLDVSYSMIAEDLKPNRLEVAKSVLSDFMNNIETDRVGIIIYAGKTFTSLPLSFDYNIIKKVIGDININTINQNYQHLQGTAMGDALVLAGKTFSDDNDREKVIILLTDGEANGGIPPLMALKYLKEKINNNIKVYTIGIGGKDKTTIKIKNNFGIYQDFVISGVDEKILKTISKETNGQYYRATDRDTFEKIFETISKLEKKEIESEVIKINKEKYKVYIYLLILFFLLFMFIKSKKNIK